MAWPEVISNNMYTGFSFQLSDTEQGVLEYFDLFVFMIKEKIIPLWEKWCDINQLDKILNEIDNERAFRIFGATMDFFMRKIIIIKLAGNPDYENIFSSTYQFILDVSKTEPTFVKYPPVLEKLYDYLKTV